jgi:hypothetical protein
MMSQHRGGPEVKYVLMFVDTEQYAADFAAMGDEERDRAYARVQQWFVDNQDRITHHVYLMPPDTATTVRQGANETLITDGPFVEGKEIISGYAEVDVADLDEALQLARSWPACPLVEIRPIAA